MKILESLINDPRFPNRKFWVFKHKPGTDGAEKFRPFLDEAYRQNVCMMQYEYGHQGPAEVTRNWNAVSKIKEGDVVFLRGNDCLYAYGVVRQHGIRPGENVRTASIKEAVERKLHGQDGALQSNDYDGLVIFEDSNVFYEDLRDGPDSWGQRIRVEQWVCYCREGIQCQNLSHYINPDRYSAILEMTNESARRFLVELTTRYYEEKGLNLMLIEQLQNCKNLILTGAPGTGKTYLAREMAMLIAKSKERVVNVQFHPSYGYSDFVEGLRPVKKGDVLGFERRDGAFMSVCRDAIAHPDEKYVIIIDEINRGDISKIFGELFSMVEAEYRSKDGITADGMSCAVKTQYNNLMADSDIFKGGFYAPPNLYIIGTMNDVDRSVESMDFAIRRRFVWHEVEPCDRLNPMCEGKGFDEATRNDIRLRMESINAKIREDPSLGPAYQVGPSYFMKLKDGDYEALWNDYLLQLFKEYLRGVPDRMRQVEIYHQLLVTIPNAMNNAQHSDN